MRQLWEQVEKFYRDTAATVRRGARHAAAPRGGTAVGRSRRHVGRRHRSQRYDADSLSEVATRLRKNRFRSETRFERLARWDVRMTRAFLLAARDLRDGRVRAICSTRTAGVRRSARNLARILADAVKDHEPRKKLASLVPKDAPYARLPRRARTATG